MYIYYCVRIIVFVIRLTEMLALGVEIFNIV